MLPIHTHSIVNLMVPSLSVAIPPSLTYENEDGQLVIVFYVQLDDGFLFKDRLEMAIEVAACASN